MIKLEIEVESLYHLRYYLKENFIDDYKFNRIEKRMKKNNYWWSIWVGSDYGHIKLYDQKYKNELEDFFRKGVKQ